MESTHLDWPSGGPTIWLAKWEELLNKAEQYEENLPTWLRDVCLAWEQVPDLVVFFSNIKLSIWKHTTAKYTPAEISSTIYFHWEHRKQRSLLKPIGKPKTTQSAFAAQGVTLNGEEAPDASEALDASEAPDASATPDTTEAGVIAPEKPKLSSNKNRQKSNNRGRRTKSTEEDSNPSTNRSCSPKSNQAKTDRNRDPCAACSGTSHTFSRCYLVLGQEQDWLTDEAREVFKNNMKAASFKKRVDDYRKALQIAQSTADE